MKTGVIVGGTGAQGMTVVRHLSSLKFYHLKVLSRDPSSPRAISLSKLLNVTLLQSSSFSYDDESFLQAAADADFAFINTDGFSVGEVAETYWGIRFWELSQRVGVKHFIYSSLEDLGSLTGHKQEFEVGHYAGKARVVDYLRSQNADPEKGTFWSVITSGPYIEMLHETLSPTKSADGQTTLFTFPLGNGAIPFIHLDDFARYTSFILSSHPTEVAGRELRVATTHASGPEIAQAFTRTTGKPARYVDIPIDTWLGAVFGQHPRRGADLPVGRRAYPSPMSPGQKRFFLPKTFAENFSHWWNVFRSSPAENTGIIRRDYALLDAILPDRVRSVEEWMQKVGYDGSRREVLKDLNDRPSGESAGNT